jgi:hypothetical protein
MSLLLLLLRNNKIKTDKNKRDYAIWVHHDTILQEKKTDNITANKQSDSVFINQLSDSISEISKV